MNFHLIIQVNSQLLEFHILNWTHKDNLTNTLICWIFKHCKYFKYQTDIDYSKIISLFAKLIPEWAQIWNQIFFFFFFFCFLGPHPLRMEVPRLGIELELQLPAYATATAARDLSHIYDLHHSSQHCWILNPPSKARDWTLFLMYSSWVCYHRATMGTPWKKIL